MTTMSVNGLKATINLPDAPKGEGVYGLPPHKQIQPYKVDEYPACPTNWMHGSDKASSYFIPVEAGKHLWIDLNENAKHKHDVAVVISVQGINPVTGQPVTALGLEQYKHKCPKHDCDFKQDRFCEECGYMWPAQNYMTTASHPNGLFWIDGWRADDTVRGFFITEEVMKGVASQIIGDDKVFAIGIAFYLSKNPKPIQHLGGVMRTMGGLGMGFGAMSSIAVQSANCDETFGISHYYDSSKSVALLSNDNFPVGGAPANPYDDKIVLTSATPASADNTSLKRRGIDRQRRSTKSIEEVEVKKLEIGAGAKISQKLCYPDSNTLDYYQDEPAGMIYVNYTDVASCRKIKEAGKRDLTNEGEGFMKKLVVGNT